MHYILKKNLKHLENTSELSAKKKQSESDKTKKKNDLSGISKRFFLAMETVGYTGYQLAHEVDGISQQVLTHIRTGRNIPSVKIIYAFLQRFPHINANWLITGKGSILSNEIPDMRSPDLKQETERPHFAEILDGIPVDEIIIYIRKYEEAKGFSKSEIYKMFLELRVQKALLEEKERAEARYVELLNMIQAKNAG